jgi:hypothetical protein
MKGTEPVSPHRSFASRDDYVFPVGGNRIFRGDRKNPSRGVMVFISLEKWIFFDILKEIVHLLQIGMNRRPSKGSTSGGLRDVKMLKPSCPACL